MQTVALPSGVRVARLGLGTWKMADRGAERAEEIATVRLALELGVSLIDTAEMYGEGAAEELIGEALAGGLRERAFIVSKVYPHNATRRGAVEACERSLRRLKTERIDLYLLHWRGGAKLADTVAAFMELRQAGKIGAYGVSNLDTADLRELWAIEGGPATAVDQVYYNLGHRGIEWELLPWCRERRVPIMAYSPLEEGRLAADPGLMAFGRKHGMSAGQAALAWLLAKDDVIVIPKTGRRQRLRENMAALDHALGPEQLAELDRLFPPPTGPRPLEMT